MNEKFGLVFVLGGLAIAVACSKQDDDLGGFDPGSAIDGGPVSDDDAGDDDTGEVLRPATVQDVDDYCTALVDALVAKDERCCSAQDKTTSRFKAIADDLATLRKGCLDVFRGAVQRGRLQIADDYRLECFDELETLGVVACTEGDDAIFGCQSVLSGTQAIGAPCRSPLECTGSTTCVGYTATDEGTCAAPAVGAACGYRKGAPIVPALTENAHVSIFFASEHPECADDGICANSICVAPEDVDGSSGDPKANGAPCSIDDECSSTFCGGADGGKTCAPFCGR